MNRRIEGDSGSAAADTAAQKAEAKSKRKAERKAEKKAERLANRLSWKSRFNRLGLATLAGVLVFLSFPLTTERDSNIWPLAWFALVPLFFALRGLTGRQGFWVGAWCGLVTNFGGFWWISEVLRDFGHLPPYVYWPLTLLNSFYQGLMFAVFALLYTRAARRRKTADPNAVMPVWHTAALFTVVELLFPMIFPWYFANGQYRFLPAIQLAELFGVMSITFVMVAFNAGLYRLVAWRFGGEPASRRELALTFAGTALVLLYGVLRIGMVDADIADAQKLKMGLVEADIGIFEKQAKGLDSRRRALTLHRNLLKHQHMSAELEAAGVDLVVWPESSYFPLADPLIKRHDHRAFALTPAGLSGHVPSGATAQDPGGGWRLLHPGTDYRAMFAAREDAVALLGPDRVDVWADAEVDGQRKARVSTSRLPVGAGEPAAVSLVEGVGFGPGQDEARLVLWVATRDGRVFSGSPGADLVEAPRPAGWVGVARAIAMRTGRDGLVVGDGILEVGDGKLTAVTLPEATPLHAVAWAPERTVALAVGARGAAWLRLEGQWRREPIDTDADLFAIAFAPSGETWVGGDGGVVFVRTAGAWRPVSLPVQERVIALAIDPFGATLAATPSTVYTRKGVDGDWSALASGTALSGAITSIAPADWVVARPFPRDVRWVRQAPTPLTPLAAFDQDPGLELGEVPERDRGALQRGFTKPLLFGGITWRKDPTARRGERLYNTALMVDAQGRVVGTYDKVYLLAFGEFMPFGDSFPDLYKMFPQAGDFTAGSEVKVFDHFGHKIGIMICYEDIMAEFTGKLAELEPNVIINVTNDAWFGRTSEPWLHLALSVFRAVENRLALVRSTNTGISTFIDATGRLQSTTRIDDPEVLIGDVALLPGGTLYAAIGNLFVWLLLAGLIVEWVVFRRRMRQAKRP